MRSLIFVSMLVGIVHGECDGGHRSLFTYLYSDNAAERKVSKEFAKVSKEFKLGRKEALSTFLAESRIVYSDKLKEQLEDFMTTDFCDMCVSHANYMLATFMEKTTKISDLITLFNQGVPTLFAGETYAVSSTKLHVKKKNVGTKTNRRYKYLSMGFAIEKTNSAGVPTLKAEDPKVDIFSMCLDEMNKLHSTGEFRAAHRASPEGKLRAERSRRVAEAKASNAMGLGGKRAQLGREYGVNSFM